jgi:hypothetical protein
MAWSPAPLAEVVGHAGTSVPVLMGHQGGWDEILMVAVPIGVFAGLLYAANRRAARLADPSHGTPPAQEAEPRNDRAGPI